MITVRVQRQADGRITGFAVSGHSGYARRGADIVCAGVSAIAQTTILGLQQELGICCSGHQADGELSCQLPTELGEAATAADLLLRTMLQGLSAMAGAYADYVQILDSKEV